MAPYNALQCSLQLPTSPDVRCALINDLWQCNLTTESLVHDQRFDSFFEYYEEQCAAALHDGKNRMLVETHQDIVDVVHELRNDQATRSSIETRLKSRLPSPEPTNKEELICDAIDLAARIWLMTFVGEFRTLAGPSQRTLQWKQDESISSLLQREFFHQTQLNNNVKLERLFTARNLEQIGGIQIKWTSNLADHLRLLDDDTRLVIFHHASFLKAQETNNIFPPGFILETLGTIALLLPEHDKDCQKWFRKHNIEYNLDSEARRCGHPDTEDRQIHKFMYWHDRLVILKQTFDEAEPSTLYQWWHDRRRRVQWYTFWVAALVLSLTIIFGLVQCIEGGLQAWKAFNP
ncbi:hypothetical protein V8E51_013997 [Hyaloscypha variabilis]